MANTLLNENVDSYKAYRRQSMGYRKYEEAFFMSAPDISFSIKTDIQDKKVTEKQAKDSLPNESLHSWLILAAVFFFNVIMGYHFMCFAMYYVTFTEAFDTSKAAAGIIGSLHSSTSSLFSIFGSVLIELYGIKPVAVGGVLTCFVGIFASAFAPNIYFLYVTYGCITGCGISFAFLAALVIIQQHFDKHRNLATSISVCGLPLGNVVSPFITNFLLDTYGWRSALILHSAIVLHTVILTMLFSPPESKRHESKKVKPSLAGFLKSLLDFSILRRCIYWPFVFCIILGRILIGSFFDHTPSRAVFFGSSLDSAGYLLTALCLGSLCARILCSIIMGFGFINPMLALSIVLLMQSTVSIAIPFCRSYIAIVSTTFTFGIAQGFLVPTIILVIVKIAGVNKFGKTRAITNIFGAVGSALATPLTGWMFDVTQNYDIPFFFSGAVGLLSSGCAFLVFIIYKYQKKTLKNSEEETETENGLYSKETERIRTFTL